MLYQILIVILIIAVFAKFSNRKNRKSYFNFAVIVLIIYCGLRNPFIYPDIENYFDYFNGYRYGFEDNFGFGYWALNKLVRVITSSFYIFSMVVSALIITGYAYSIKKFSPYIFLSLILYILINYYPSFFLLRQYLAMAICLYSLKYVVGRDPLKYGLCMLLALSFHLTSLVAIPLYFLYAIKYNKKNMILLAIGSAIVISLFASMGDIVGRISTYYSGYFERENETAWQRALMKVYIAVVYLFALNHNSYKAGINRVVFYCMILNVIICIAAMNTYGVFRLREYFSLADYIGVPIILKEASVSKSSKRFLLYIMCYIYIAMLFVSFDTFIKGGNMDDAYQFFWESKTL